MITCVSCSGSSLIPFTLAAKSFLFAGNLPVPIVPVNSRSRTIRNCGIRASMVDSSSDFIKRMERAWLICQQPRPIVCSSCDSKGHTECKWCGGTGFFILGDNMLCEVPSKNTSCVICSGKVLLWDQRAALIVKEQAFVQNGWKNLLLPKSKTNTQKYWNTAVKL